MEILKQYWRATLGVLIFIPCALFLLYGLAYFDNSQSLENIKQAKSQGYFSDKYPSFANLLPLNMSTECIGLNVAMLLEPKLDSLLSAKYSGTCENIGEKPAELKNYAQRWHGYVLVLKPLYSLLPVWAVGLISGLCSLALLGLLYYSASLCLGRSYGGILALSFFLTMNLGSMLLLTQAIALWLAMLGSIIVFWQYNDERPPIYTFAALGALESFFGLLLTGSLSLSLPLLCFCLVRLREHQSGWKIIWQSILVILAWLLGFMLFWIARWGLVAMFTDIQIMPLISTYFASLTWAAYGSGLIALFSHSAWIIWLILGLLLIWRGFKVKTEYPKALIIVMLPAFVPLGWLAFLPGSVGELGYGVIVIWPLIGAIMMLLMRVPFGHGQIEFGFELMWDQLKDSYKASRVKN